MYFLADLKWHPFGLCPRRSIPLGSPQPQPSFFFFRSRQLELTWSEENSCLFSCWSGGSLLPRPLALPCLFMEGIYSQLLIFWFFQFDSRLQYLLLCTQSNFRPHTHKFSSVSSSPKASVIKFWCTEWEFCILKVSSRRGWSGFSSFADIQSLCKSFPAAPLTCLGGESPPFLHVHSAQGTTLVMRQMILSFYNISFSLGAPGFCLYRMDREDEWEKKSSSITTC